MPEDTRTERLAALQRDKPRALFLDDGGVLNDNGLRAPEWQRLIGEFMPPRLGGTAQAWASANRVLFPAFWEQEMKPLMRSFTNHREFQRVYEIGWVRRMCGHLGIPAPTDDEATRLYREMSIYIGGRANAAIPGAAEAVLSLRAAGHPLHMASGQTSWELKAILGKMGIIDAFATLCGPDLADHVKHGPAFYERVFAHAAVDPAQAVVIDSEAECCEWAKTAGAQALWIDSHGRGDAPSLAALVSGW